MTTVDACGGNLSRRLADLRWSWPTRAGEASIRRRMGRGRSAAPWIYTIGVGFTGLDPGSFHPTVAGQEEFAILINGCLAGTVSC